MAGFGDMSRRIPTDAIDLTPEERIQQADFEYKTHVIFPEGTASRLARACGGVNIRTSQKWLSHQIIPPQDVLDFVNAQYVELKRTGYVDALEALIKNGTGNLDVEVVGSQLGRQYTNITGSKIR